MVFSLSMHLFGVFSSPWSFVADCCCFCCPRGLVLILYGKRLSFPILVRIWRLAWFLLQVPPSGRTAKRTLEWVAFTPDSEGACGLGIFLFLVRDTPFPSLLSLHCLPRPTRSLSAFAAPGAAPQPHPAARTPRRWRTGLRSPCPSRFLLTPSVSGGPLGGSVSDSFLIWLCCPASG